MSNNIVVDGDTLKFETLFGANTVTPTGSCLIKGNGEASIDNKKICILGDEKKVSIAASYFSADYPISGNGTITITALAGDQLVPFATATMSVIKVGSKFTAQFTVGTPPASHPQNGNDKTPSSVGSGQFINNQAFVSAG